MPAKPKAKPMTALGGNLGPLVKNEFTTSHKGTMALMMAASPPEIYLSPQVARPLVKIKLNSARMKMVFQSLMPGHDALPVAIK